MVDEAESESKIKQSVEASKHLQYFMEAIKHKPSKWEDLEKYQMSHKFWGSFSTYMGKHARNKTTARDVCLFQIYGSVIDGGGL